MAARPIWKGSLKISLVTIPIKVFPATDAGDGISFNQLHQTCQTRVQQKRWCGTCDREVPTAEIVKGHEFEKGKFVVLSEEDFDKVKPASTKIIDLVQFADASALDPIYVDRSYYLGPDGDRAGEAFAVVASALRGVVGIGKLAIYGREYLVAVRAAPVSGAALLLHTLHHAAEIRAIDTVVDDTAAAVKRVPIDQVQLARQVIGSLLRPRDRGLDLAGFTDDYKVGLQKVIDAKIAGEEIVEPKAIDAPPVVALKDALTRSLQLVTGAKPAAAKAADRRPVKRKRAS
jgi:DNA end-binding protein Ku